MNKKILLLALSFILLGGVKMEASEQGFNVSLSVKRIDHIPGIPGGSKNPIEFPTVSQDGHTIEIDIPHPEYVLNIVDSNDNVVYTVVVPSNVSEVDLPDTLSGTYELQLIQGNWCFYGDITL